MWQFLNGKAGYLSGASGSATVPPGAFVHVITAHASAGAATVAIFGGTAIPIINGAPPWSSQFNHTLFQSNNQNGGTIVFTNTDSYFVHYVTMGQTS